MGSSPRGLVYGGHAGAVHGSRVWFTMDSVHPLPSPHGVQCTESTQQPPAHLLSLLPHVRAPASGEQLFSRYGGSHATPYSSTSSQGHKGLNEEEVAVD
jgi:hypothetical protein